MSGKEKYPPLEYVGDDFNPVRISAYDKDEYIVDYEEYHFESFWNEECELWSVYQSKKTEDGYKLEVHFLDNKPIATVEDVKTRIELWKKFKEVILDGVKSEVKEE
jgi:hypothetical protein